MISIQPTASLFSTTIFTLFLQSFVSSATLNFPCGATPLKLPESFLKFR